MKLTHLFHRCFRLTVLGLVGIPSLSFAADASQDSLFDLSIADLQATRVTAASLFDESERDTASSVTVLESDEWTKTGARRLSDALEAVPSVATYPTWGGAEAIAIRGYATELSVRGLANTLDGVPLNSYAYATSLYDKPIINLAHLDRIEVIRGPGSTLYGSDAFHGVIARQLKESDQDAVSATVRVSESNYADASAFVSKGIDGARVNAGVAITRQNDQDLAYNYTSPDDGLQYASERAYDYKDVSMFSTISGEFSARTRYKFTAYIDDYRADGFPGQGRQFFARLPSIFDLKSASLTEDNDYTDQNSNFWLGAFDVAHDIGKAFSLEAKIYHWNSEQEWIFDNSRYPTSLTTLSNTTLPCKNAANAGVNPNPIYCPHGLTQSNEEHRSGLHVYMKSQQRHFDTQWAVGFGRDRLKIEQTDFRRVALDGEILLDQENPYLGSRRTIDFALFQAKTGFVDDRVQLVYGLRADSYSDLDTHLSPRMGAVYQVSERYTTKLLYGHAYRAPTAIERLGSVQGTVANPDIEPEIMDTLEWVNSFYGQSYSLETTLFANRWKDGIVLVPTTPPLNQYVNTGQNESYGVEFVARRQIELLRLEGSASFVDSRNMDADTDYVAFPTWILNLEGGYRFFGTDLELILKQRIMLDYAESDYLGVTKPESADDYFRTDLSLVQGLDLVGMSGNHSAFLHVYNVFDQDNVLPSLYNSEGGLVDRGVSFDLGLSFEW